MYHHRRKTYHRHRHRPHYLREFLELSHARRLQEDGSWALRWGAAELRGDQKLAPCCMFAHFTLPIILRRRQPKVRPYLYLPLQIDLSTTSLSIKSKMVRWTPFGSRLRADWEPPRTPR